MKTILLKLLLFIVIIVTLITVMVLLSDYLINKRKDKVLELSPDRYIVFAGNSTVECAVEDKLIDHSINVAQAGEAYLYSFAKIKALLDQNTHIRTFRKPSGAIRPTICRTSMKYSPKKPTKKTVHFGMRQPPQAVAICRRPATSRPA